MTVEPGRVFVLAGGLGTRLRALYPDRPKAMVPVAGRPFLEHQVRLLAGQGFCDFVFCVGYLAEQIMAYFEAGARWGVRIAYSRELRPLGTAGALKYAADFWAGPALVLNGDTYLEADFMALVSQHAENASHGVTATIALMRVADPSPYGQVSLEPDGRIRAFEEKQAAPTRAGLVNAGAYVFEPAILQAIPAGRAVSIEQETFPALLSAGAKVYGAPLEGTFIDIGTPEGLATLERHLTRKQGASQP